MKTNDFVIPDLFFTPKLECWSIDLNPADLSSLKQNNSVPSNIYLQTNECHKPQRPYPSPVTYTSPYSTIHRYTLPTYIHNTHTLFYSTLH